jgi:hypothetical protein
VRERAKQERIMKRKKKDWKKKVWKEQERLKEGGYKDREKKGRLGIG